ncbi:MFS transporter [Thermoactinomyces sp. CICC 10522]|nr:MFS transporter [Thermoactinomyces sp. CICC 10522]
MQGGWPIGVLFASLMTAILEPYIGWRGTYLVATFPAIVIVTLWSRLEESPRFKQMQQLRRLIKENRRAEAQQLALEYNIDLSKMEKTPIRQMFGSDIRKHTIFLSLAFLCNWLAIQVFSVLSTTVLVNGKHITFSNSLFMLILSNALSYIGYLVHGYVGDRIGRRTTVGIVWMLSAVCYCYRRSIIDPGSPKKN